MKKPIPIAQERKFEVADLFFSTTNEKGLIEFGNDVFVRVSGYSKSQLEGAPHNIIRHPDMPKAAFKLLWDTLKSGKMMGAYVKNMAFDGSFYWVYAVIFPVGNRYLSIRLKPTTGIKDIVEKLYGHLLSVEKESGMEKSIEVLNAEIAKLGFASYEQFFVKALQSEIESRDKILNANHIVAHQFAGPEDLLKLISTESAAATFHNKNIFKKIDQIEMGNKVISQNTEKLKERFSDFQVLSLNIQVLAAKVGESGKTLSVIAQDFNNLVVTIDNQLNLIADGANEINNLILKFSRNICSLKFLTDMVDFFVQETVRTQDIARQNEKVKDLQMMSDIFVKLAHNLVAEFGETKKETVMLVENFAHLNSESRKFVNAIELIAQLGYIEVARIPDDQNGFKHSIDSMKRFSEILRDSLKSINDSTKELLVVLKAMDQNLNESNQSVQKIFKLCL